MGILLCYLFSVNSLVFRQSPPSILSCSGIFHLAFLLGWWVTRLNDTYTYYRAFCCRFQLVGVFFICESFLAFTSTDSGSEPGMTAVTWNDDRHPELDSGSVQNKIYRNFA